MPDSLSKQPPEMSESQPSELQSFTSALRHILSVKKSDLDLHKPIRPRKGKQKKSTS
jgi:hypothetical protein